MKRPVLGGCQRQSIEDRIEYVDSIGLENLEQKNTIGRRDTSDLANRALRQYRKTREDHCKANGEPPPAFLKLIQ